MVNYVASGKTTKRVVQSSVFLLALGFAVLAYIATPLTTFAACPNEKPTQTAKQTANRNGVNQANRVAVLMGKQRVASLRRGDKVRVKIATNGNFSVNGKRKILMGLYLGNSEVSVSMNNMQGKRQTLILPLRDPGVV